MDLLLLILYGGVNTAMILYCLTASGRYNQFPFWAGVISMGWFFPQAVGGYINISRFPGDAYADAMLFATLCSLALWIGFDLAAKHAPARQGWLGFDFQLRRLYWAGAVLCAFGFFFQMKLWSLPEEMLEASQWSGATVKYLFLASVFKFGFIVLWLLLLNRKKWLEPKLLVFIVPSLLLLFDAAVLRGRRAEIMNLVAYIFVSLWLVRRVALPRWMIISGLAGGLLLVNGIGTYRAIMEDEDLPLSDRLSKAAEADYIAHFQENLEESGSEFKNYVFYRQIYAEEALYDLGGDHWNRLVFNFVPAQIFGRDFKESLMLQALLEADDHRILAQDRYGHMAKTGATSTGYTDAFASFSWLGFLKFLLVGGIMGTLYRYAMQGRLLGQLLYVYMLGPAMHAITHGTHRVLVSEWIYFFLLCFPVLWWAKSRVEQSVGNDDPRRLMFHERVHR